jgi:putative FmdB family regulatory protein|uniref:Zinc ribbon domain-containing protein n=1 Tax=Desulfobacca acetoxidans TaxID=60893 RepID=A0A7C3UZW9_9BACT
MPIYEYQCAACGKVTEAWQKFSDEPLTVCPACGGAMNKLISNCAFHLKGSGWYVSDYSSSRPNSATPDTGKDSGESSAAKSSEPAAAATPAASSKIK